MADEGEENCDIHESLNLQLSEIEILQSMFREEKELNIDHNSLVEIQDFLSGSTNIKPNRIAFTLKLFLDEDSNNQNFLEVNCCLPRRYPYEMPDVYVKSSSLTRELQKELNEGTGEFLSSLERGELCVVTLIQWLQETWREFFERSQQFTNCKEIQDNKTGNEEGNERTLSRVWLYMHHIYSKTKRKHIIDWADDSKLTGFSLPGKPGVVCIEGDVRDTDEYFSRLRRLNWKKITCRHREEGIVRRRFVDFKELVLHVHGSADDRMDMGEFFQFLVKHDLGDMFKMLFGIEGK